MVIVIVGIMIYLQIFEQQKDFLTYSIFGMVGLAVAIGSVPACHNALGGLYLVFHAPFKVDDYIEIGNVSGVVSRVALRYTVLRTLKGTTTFVPNSYFLIQPMINYSQRPKRQLEIYVELVPETPVTLIRQLMEETEVMLQTLHTGLTSHRLNLVDTTNREDGDDGEQNRFFFVAMDELYKIRIYSYTEELDPKRHAMIKSEVWLALAEIMEDLKIEQVISKTEEIKPYLGDSMMSSNVASSLDFTSFK